MRSVACILLLAAAARAQSVEGTIVNTATGRGIPGARVILFRAGERASQPLYSATADSGGRFRIEDVKEGGYTPHYSAEHFFAANVIPNGPEFHVVATASPVRLEGRLAPNAHVAGRVLDGRGDPAPNARVDLTLSKAFWAAQTDSQGRFDLDSAIAGPSDYRLSALPPAGWKPPNPNPDSRQPRAWARTFYPAALRREDAAPLVLFPGIDIRDLEIRLLAVDVHVVRGMLVTAEGAQAAKVLLSLWEAGPRRDATYKTEPQPDGSFEFPAVVEGAWRLTSISGNLRADQWIDVKGHDQDVGKIRLAPPFTLHGRMAIEVPQGLAVPRGPEVLLLPQHAGQIVFGGPPIRDTVPYADGSFRFDNVYAGDYLILPGEPPPLFYIDSVRLGETALEGEVELSAASPEVVIVYKTNGGTARGTVENCGTGTVLLTPQSGPAWGSRTGTCDGAGRFEIGGLRPGEYHALAFPGDQPVTPETVGPFLPGAARFTVRAGEVTRTDLKLSGLR
jgi:5-hydroxyisourate hydrolase-like protein (transthyretin family)